MEPVGALATEELVVVPSHSSASHDVYEAASSALQESSMHAVRSSLSQVSSGDATPASVKQVDQHDGKSGVPEGCSGDTGVLLLATYELVLATLLEDGAL